MDPFLENYWNLDQIRVWAETRDPDLVRAAALPRYGTPKKTLELAIRSTHAAIGDYLTGRDIGGELWAASGWKPKLSKFTAPPMIQKHADEHGVAAYQIYWYNDLYIQRPVDPAALVFDHAFRQAPDADQTKVAAIVCAHLGDNAGVLADARLNTLRPDLAQQVRKRFSSHEAQGPPNVFVRETFRTLDYLKTLFETGRLQAVGSRPSNPEAVVISTLNWSGLEIAVGGEHQRLSVWLRGKVGFVGHGEYEKSGSQRRRCYVNSPQSRQRLSTSVQTLSPTTRFSISYATPWRRTAASSGKMQALTSCDSGSQTLHGIGQDSWSSKSLEARSLAPRGRALAEAHEVANRGRR
ncbi:MAG: hypothetical protein JO288_10405 [Hyphomicrobiales bacterium]|nr:hypothetical protein [Hyphomicrobiales bacterium]